MILLDANVLVYAVNADSPQHGASRAVVDASMNGRVPGVLVPQVLLEFFAVVTNPKRVTKPLDSFRAWRQVTALRSSLPLLHPGQQALTELDRLMHARRPTCGRIFDTNLVAQMHAQGFTQICTYNVADFAAFTGVTALTPEEVLAKP
mgnify:CR=1 FL=1